jgi:hypothetical protein
MELQKLTVNVGREASRDAEEDDALASVSTSASSCAAETAA